MIKASPWWGWWFHVIIFRDIYHDRRWWAQIRGGQPFGLSCTNPSGPIHVIFSRTFYQGFSTCTGKSSPCVDLTEFFHWFLPRGFLIEDLFRFFFLIYGHFRRTSRSLVTLYEFTTNLILNCQPFINDLKYFYFGTFSWTKTLNGENESLSGMFCTSSGIFGLFGGLI